MCVNIHACAYSFSNAPFLLPSKVYHAIPMISLGICVGHGADGQR